jgi:selenium metabolism protein YedF
VKNQDYIVVIAADHMGSGDENLGKILMKSFLFALNQQEHLPQSILLYNSGVRLVAKGSESLEDLISMQKAGVHIASCGTCLDYLNLKDELEVGEVANMFAIAEAQTQAEKVIRP